MLIFFWSNKITAKSSIINYMIYEICLTEIGVELYIGKPFRDRPNGLNFKLLISYYKMISKDLDYFFQNTVVIVALRFLFHTHD